MSVFTPERRPVALRGLILALFVGACLVFGAAQATKAQAYQEDYCGYLIPTNATIGSYDCYSTPAWLSYNSARYSGGGNILVLTAGLRGNETLSPYSTFTSLCYYAAAYSRGGLRQNDSGAAHTIEGHVDDSPNHTGCIS